MAKHTFTMGWKSDSGAALSKPVAVTDAAETALDLVVPDATTNQLATIAIDISQTSDLYLVSNCNVTIKTNSTSSPGDTITLLAGIPLVWFTGCGYAIPLSVDVTALYVTNASGQQATVQLRLGYHP